MATDAPDDVPPPDYGVLTGISSSSSSGDELAVFDDERTTKYVGGQSDLARLDVIAERTLLQVVKSRFNCGNVQTYVGESLLIVNPYKNIDIYGHEWHLRYVNLASRHCAAPHVYHIADRAYRAMRSTGYEQCIVVSGESGAGKTETTKHVIEHVTFICADNARDLHERIVKVNPLLEAFGNALTVRNSNSSRFGKLVEMKFNERSELVAANVSEYMLEKSRVVHQAPGECNFHIFFYLFAGMPAEKLKRYRLGDPRSYRIMRSAQAVWADANRLKHYATMFNEIEFIFERLGFDDHMKSLIYTSIAAILFVTNVEFTTKIENKADVLVFARREPVNNAAHLLSINAESLAEVLVSNTTSIRGEVLRVNKNIEQACGDRDALAKELYSRLFSWIVRRVNENLQSFTNDSSPRHQTISVLDLSGFENLQLNSFEQLCINMANEHILQFFKENLIRTEKDVYIEEGVPWPAINWTNDNPLLKLCLQKPIGLFQLLDEECRVPKGSDKSLLRKWQTNFASNNSYLQFAEEALRSSSTTSLTSATGCLFIVKHYAGLVEYDITGFLEKNRDRLSMNLEKLMESSNMDSIKDLFSTELYSQGRIIKSNVRPHDSGSTNSRHSTASQCFLNSLDDLVNKMRKGSPHFIWCVKPNNNKQPNEFDGSLVSNQLRYNGITQIALVRRDGFPIQQTHRDFITRYQCVCVGFHAKMTFNAASCHAIMEKVAMRNLDFAVGKTKVFMKEHTVEALQVRVEQYAAVVLQSSVRGRNARSSLKNMRTDQKLASSPTALVTSSSSNCDNITSDRQQHIIINTMEQQPHNAFIGSANDLEDKAVPTKACEMRHSSQRNVYEKHGDVNAVLTSASDLTSVTKSMLNDVVHSDAESDVGRSSSNDVPTSVGQLSAETECVRNDSDSGPESDVDDVKPPWDVAQNIPRERISSTEAFVGLVKGLKVFTYIFIFVVVWLTATVGTGCFLLLVSSLRHGGVSYAQAKLQLITIMSVPYSLIFIISVVKAVFGRVPWPSFSMAFGMVMVEVLHNFGMVILVLRVLPCFGGLYGLGIMHSICLIPSILAIVFVRHKKPNHCSQACRDSLTWILDFIAMLLSIAAVAMPLVVSQYNLVNVQWANQGISMPIYSPDMSTIGTVRVTTLLPLVNMSDVPSSPFSVSNVTQSPQQRVPTSTKAVNSSQTRNADALYSNLTTNPDLYWQMPVAMILVSLKWWENFVGDNRGFLKLFQVKRQLHIVRVKVNIIMSFFGVVSIIATTCLIEYLYKRTTGSFLGYVDLTSSSPFANSFRATQSEANNDRVKTWVPGILCVACGLVCYYMSSLACKLLMQRASFCVPLCLAPPTLATLIVLQCFGIISSVPISSTISFDFLCDVSMDNYGYYVTGAALWYIVFLWICRHIWFPKAERMAKSEKLFVTPLFNGVLFAQSLIINRRRNDNELRKSGKGHLVMIHEDGNISTAGFYGVNTIDAKLQSSQGNDFENPRKKTLKTTNRIRPVPVIYACATMWHETSNEMIQLLKSIFRMDADQCTRGIAQRVFKVKDPDYYEFEAHIFFDDCMDFNDDDQWVCNTFVKQFIQVIDEAASSVLNEERKMPPPTKIPTPYGGRLVWRLPGGNNLVVHLKDKLKIRHKKRWSQVMYMYYLLGYRLFGEGAECVKEFLNSNGADATSTGESSKNRKMPNWLERAKLQQNKREHFGKSSIFETMEESLVETAENTFLLALDGDVDFKPDAVRLLVNRMLKNEKTGATCGRIHPIGSGPLVWYQNFEYAVGHWFQKATEHVLGCVLCSPGCFSLFRGSALMDDNVMKKYSTMSTEARHFLQYDQGEDRWLCTLLLQQGYRIDYSAAADALTYAPENFDEFFNQRRRWGPSTIANIWDLLADFTNTVFINDNISKGFMLYQFFLMVTTILGPSTIVITVASAFKEVFNLGSLMWVAYLIAIIPPAVYLVICFMTKTKRQLLMAKVLCTMYAVVMTVVLVGLIVNMTDGDILNPSLFFLAFVSASFVLAGLIHPYEFFCLLHGILYFICIPSGYLILMIYSMSNMHIVSWGTREIPKRKSKKQQATESASEAAPKKKRSIFSFFRMATESVLLEIKSTLIQIFHRPEQEAVNKAILEELKRIRLQLKRSQRQKTARNNDGVDTESDSDTASPQTVVNTSVKPRTGANNEPSHGQITTDTAQSPLKPAEEPEEELNEGEDPNNPPWIRDSELGDGEVDYLDVDELQFWQSLIRKYLQPIKKNKKAEEKMQRDLIELRNNASFGFWMINFIWIVLNFMLQSHVSSIVIFYRSSGDPVKCEPLSFVYIIFFLLILTLQVIGMLKHRWGTFLEVMMITELESPFTRRRRQQVLREKEHISVQEALRLTNKTLRLMAVDEPKPDYDDDDCEELDDRDVSDGDNDLISVRPHGSRPPLLDRMQSRVSSNLDELDPLRVRDQIRQHFIESQKDDRRKSSTDLVQHGRASRYEKHAEGRRYTDQDVDHAKSLGKKNAWKREYIRRIQTGNRERPTVRFRHLATTDPLTAEDPYHHHYQPSMSPTDGRDFPRRSDARPTLADGAGGTRRDRRYIRANELERVFARKLNQLSRPL